MRLPNAESEVREVFSRRWDECGLRSLAQAVWAAMLALSGMCKRGRVMRTNVLDAEHRLSQLIKPVQAGEEVVIVNRGEPRVSLIPVHGKGARAAGPDSPQAMLAWLENRRWPPFAIAPLVKHRGPGQAGLAWRPGAAT